MSIFIGGNVNEEEIPNEVAIKLFPKISRAKGKKLKATKESLYSVTKPEVAERISDIIEDVFGTNNIQITDATANVGGMTIALAKKFKKVISHEKSDVHCEFLKNNVNLFGLDKKVKVICGDFLEHDYKTDMVVFDPPWGRYDYKKFKNFSLFLNKRNIVNIAIKWLENAKYVGIFVPFNYNIIDVYSKSNINFSLYRLENNRNTHSFLILSKN